MDFFTAALANPLLLYALLAGLLAAIPSGIVGAYVVVKRIVFISGSIAHSILGGIGLCVYLQRTQNMEWASPLYGALLFGILSALLMGWIHLAWREREDTVIAAIWSIGMAAGIIFISQTPGFNVELTSFLIGNILWVSPEDLKFLFVLDLLIIVLALLMHKRLLIVCFDEEQAELQGIRPQMLYLLLLSLIAVTVVLLIQVVGIVMVMTLLTIPPALGNLISGRLSYIMLFGILISALLSVTGTALSYHLDWPSGATIALLAGLVYITAQTARSQFIKT